MSSNCTLPSYNKPLVFNLTDAVDIMNKKIIVNNMSIECLQLQIKYSATIRNLQLIFAKKAQQKIDLVNKLNSVLSQQLATFDEIRQEEANELYKELNELDESDCGITNLINENKKIGEDVESLMIKIDAIEKTIPNNKMMTNFKVKFSTNPQSNSQADPDTI
jgi:hypothetical protein